MTIDGAIECAELMSRNMVLFDFDNDEDRCFASNENAWRKNETGK